MGNSPYIDGIYVSITFDWHLILGMSWTGRALNWVQTLSGIESTCKKLSVQNFKYKNSQELAKIIRPGVKIKNLKMFFKKPNQGIFDVVDIYESIK